MIWIIAVILLGLISIFCIGALIYGIRAKDDYAVAFGGIGFMITLILIVGSTLFASFHTVQAGHVGVVYEFGGITGQTGDGPVWIAPWKNIKAADTRVQKVTFEEIAAASRETQDVTYQVTLNYRVSPDAVQGLFRNVGVNYFDILVPSRLQQILKDESVQYEAIEITQKRDELREAVASRLAAELLPYSVSIVSLQIDNIDYSEEFNRSIEAKQVATQDALREQQRVQQAIYEAQQAVERANGEAQANRILSESITTELLQRQAIDKLNPNVTVIMVPSSEGIIIDPGSLIR